MNKNIVICGVVVFSILVVARYMMAVVWDNSRFDPEPVVEAEVQSCKTDNDCTIFHKYCGGGCPISIATSNSERYGELFKKHCELNPPATVAKASCENNWPACNKGVCTMVPLTESKLITSLSTNALRAGQL